MDSGGFQNNISNRARVCTSVPDHSVDVGQTTPDASIVVHGELHSLTGNTQLPNFPGDTSILDSDGASCFFNLADLAYGGELSSANGSTNLAEQSRPVQCTSPNRSLDTLVRQAQRPAAQSCIETMLTPGSADQVLCQQGQLQIFTSADPASCSNSQNLGFCHGEKWGLLQQRHSSQLDNQMVSFPGSYHSKQPRHSVPNSQEMAEQGFTYCGDGIFKCDTCSVKLSTKQSPIASDILKNHHQLCRRQYDTQQYEIHVHSPQEQMLPKTPEHAAMVFAEDENGHKHVLCGPVKYPEYAAYHKRVESFRRMLFSASKIPRELASAGLYFLREPDQVACFSCDIGFRNWEPDDDPCKEHARQSPNCTFVKQVLHRSAQQPISGTSTTIQARTLATTGTSTSFQPGTLATNGSSASIMTGNLATNGSIDNWQHQLPMDSLSQDVSNISLDGIPSMSSEIDYQVIADMGYQPDQIRRAVSKLRSKKYIGVINTNSIVNEILEMDEIKAEINLEVVANTILDIDRKKKNRAWSVCYLCQQDFINGYTLCPCGHLAVCMKCKVYKDSKCPVCGEIVKSYVITYPECQTRKP